MSSLGGLPYTSVNDPAPDIGSLVDFLRGEDKGQFLYRGQTRLWPGPLFPSAFRRYRKTSAIYTCDSPEYGRALRKVGRRFVGLVPINFFHETLSLFCPPHPPSTLTKAEVLAALSDVPPPPINLMEAEILERLSNNQYLARTLINGADAIEIMLSNLELELFRGRFEYWKQVIDYDHRMQIRDMVFMRPFGYLLGQGLAQQYGFSSEMLDVSTDPLVAAFFATYEAPHFLSLARAEIGVIYRFLRPPPASPPLDLGTYNFYSCPSVLDLVELFDCFRSVEDSEELHNDVESFLVKSFQEHQTWRRWEAFRVSSAILSASRIMRQSAALLVPDAIYVERDSTVPLPGKVRVLMAIEDCAMREGTTLFYFHHRGDVSVCEHITREYLWPNEEDAFFGMIGNALLMSVCLEKGQILPSRIDLLDPGYQW